VLYVLTVHGFFDIIGGITWAFLRPKSENPPRKRVLSFIDYGAAYMLRSKPERAAASANPKPPRQHDHKSTIAIERPAADRGRPYNNSGGPMETGYAFTLTTEQIKEFVAMICDVYEESLMDSQDQNGAIHLTQDHILASMERTAQIFHNIELLDQASETRH
jgi:hypothetical protein